MIVSIIIIVLFILIAGLLCLPTSIVADTDHKLYFVSIPFYFKATAMGLEETWKIQIRIFQIPLNIKIPAKIKPSHEKEEIKKKKTWKKIRKMSLNRILQITKKTIHSFRIKQLKASIDTGDFPLNAQLIPLTSRFNDENISIGINFNNTNSLYMRVVTRLYKLTWIIFRYIIF